MLTTVQPTSVELLPDVLLLVDLLLDVLLGAIDDVVLLYTAFFTALFGSFR